MTPASVLRVELRPATGSTAPSFCFVSASLIASRGHNPERLRVSFESVREAGVTNQSIEFLFRDVSERRMAQIMGESCGLGGVRIDTSKPSQV